MQLKYENAIRYGGFLFIVDVGWSKMNLTDTDLI